jgi:hypothetical protein
MFCQCKINIKIGSFQVYSAILDEVLGFVDEQMPFADEASFTILSDNCFASKQDR